MRSDTDEVLTVIKSTNLIKGDVLFCTKGIRIGQCYSGGQLSDKQHGQKTYPSLR
jgi:hypothetical protein